MDLRDWAIIIDHRYGQSSNIIYDYAKLYRNFKECVTMVTLVLQ